MKFSVYSIGILLVTLLSVTACLEAKNDSLPEPETESVLIHEEEVEMVEPPPPPPGIDLSVFNVFVLDDQSVYYYYEPSFKAKKEVDKYRLENLKEELIHKTSYEDLMTTLGKLIKDNALVKKRVLMAVKDEESEVVKQMAEEMLQKLGVKEVGTGLMAEEVESLLKKNK